MKKNKGGSKQSYKVGIVSEYIEKFPQATTAAISRMVHNENTVDFPTYNSALCMVRYYRDGRVGKQERVRSEEQAKEARRRFAIPESDYVELDPYLIPKGQNKILYLTDIHIPYHDVDAVEIALEYGYKHGVNTLYLNGDIMDCYQVSRWVKDRRLRDMGGELEMTRVFLKMIKKEFDCPIYYKMGNHEDRWENFLKMSAPELLGISEFELATLLRFGELGIIEISSKRIAKAGKLNLMHGHEFGHSVFSPVNPARGLYMRAKENSIIGHHHQTSEHSEKNLTGDVVTTWSVGALCGMRPEYYPYNKWNLGFAIIETSDNGDFEVNNKRIIEGKVR